VERCAGAQADGFGQVGEPFLWRLARHGKNQIEIEIVKSGGADEVNGVS